MKCSRCSNTYSPQGARFCVTCGYALLQSCPYECGFESLTVRGEQAIHQCPHCERFLMVCLNCSRLHPLGARECQTARCKISGITPIEPFAFHSGFSGGSPVIIEKNWHLSKPPQLDSAWGEFDGIARFGGLAARYGSLVWWKNEQLYVLPHQISGTHWLPVSIKSFNVVSPPFVDGLFPIRDHLHLAHGNAYLSAPGTYLRISLSNIDSTNNVQAAGLYSQISETPDQETRLKDTTQSSLSGVDNISGHPTQLQNGDSESGDFDFGFELDFSESEANVPQKNDPISSIKPVDDESAWSLHEIQWLSQNSTSTHWFGIGHLGEALVGVQSRGADALFTVGKWNLPSSIRLEDWRELLIFDDKPVLRTTDAIWKEEDGKWREIFTVLGQQTLEGAMPDKIGFWLWGRRDSRMWVRYVRNGGSEAELSMPFDREDRVFPFPVVWSRKITFFQLGQRNSIVTLNLDRPLEDAVRQDIPAGISIVWATSVLSPTTGFTWLLYASDDAEVITFWMMALSPEVSSPIELVRFHPQRNRSSVLDGPIIAATIGGGKLFLSYANENGHWIRAFDMSHSLTPVTNPSH